MNEIMASLSEYDIDSLRSLYLDLLKLTLTRYFGGIALPRRVENYDETFDANARAEGRDWPLDAETMVGLRRLENLESCVTDVIRRCVPGDLIETGVWRGGACIFMCAVLKAYGVRDRTVWVADSFRGLPKPDASQTEDTEDALWTFPYLAVSIDQVRENFARYGMLDEQVRFLPGWFHDTLPTAEIERISVMRLDGDMYDSTMVALRSLYPKLSVGGYVIVDDYDAVRGCRRAVDDFRAEHNIQDNLCRVDWSCRYWRRSVSSPCICGEQVDLAYGVIAVPPPAGCPVHGDACRWLRAVAPKDRP